MSFATLRTALATSIANPSVWSTYSFPPPQVTANSCSIVPDDPYVQPTNNGSLLSLTVRFKIEMAIPLFDNQGNLAGIETMLQALVPLIPTTYNISSISQPRVMSLPSGDLLICDVSLETIGSWS